VYVLWRSSEQPRQGVHAEPTAAGRWAPSGCSAPSLPLPAPRRLSPFAPNRPCKKADRFAWGLTYCPPEFLEWGHRWRLITRQLEGLGADVVCLQEVDASK
jgi:hypothetical protein